MHNNFFGRVREWFTRGRRALWTVLCFYLAASALSLVLSARVRISRAALRTFSSERAICAMVLFTLSSMIAVALTRPFSICSVKAR